MTPIPHASSDPAATAMPAADSSQTTSIAAGAEPAQGGMPPAGSGVVDAAGEFGTIVSSQAISGSDGLSEMVVVRHREQQVLLPAGLFSAISATSFRIPLSFAALTRRAERDGSDAGAHGAAGNIVIPVLQEEMQVGTRLVDTGRGVRVHKQVIETPHVVEQALLQDRLAIEHVAVGRLLDEDEHPQARQEGDVLILPIVEEVLVVQTRRRLKEEVRIVRSSVLVQQQQTVLLKSEQVAVERFDESAGTGTAAMSDTEAGHASAGHATTEYAPGAGSNADAGRIGPTTPESSGWADQPGNPGAIQRDVSAGTRLSS